MFMFNNASIMMGECPDPKERIHEVSDAEHNNKAIAFSTSIISKCLESASWVSFFFAVKI